MSLFKRFFRRSQTGQSLVILAIGFLGLLGFVGIVTDVSVLFIRYSTMKRAIDAAAVAAAGQMRRVPDTELNQIPAVADGQAASVANLNLAARQFIELYGLNPKNVTVETCRAQEVARDAAGNPYDAPLFLDPPFDTQPNPAAHLLFMPDGTDNPAADPAVLKRYKELCTPDELKLVRVTAQIDSPTIFLRLLGYPTVTLTDSAISQTAVIDAVMIFDTAPSMLNETTYDTWKNIPGSPDPMDVRYVPPNMPPANDPLSSPGCAGVQPWTYLAASSQATLNMKILPTNPPDCVIQDQTIAFEVDPLHPLPSDPQHFKPWVESPAGSGHSAEGVYAPPAFCQVRAYPSTIPLKGPVEPSLKQDYYAFLGDGSTFGYGLTHTNSVTGLPEDYNNNFYTPLGGNNPSLPAYYTGFVPMYNSFACCNDPLEAQIPSPTGDGVNNISFRNMICQPMKDARDAAHSFLDRLDFLRGDRIAYVTFDRTAVPVDPDGNGQQASMMETQDNLYTIPGDTSSPLLRKGASETLDDVVGVQADTDSYADTNADGMWDALNDGGNPRTYNDPLNVDDEMNYPIGSMVNAPVINACPFDEATTDPDYLSATDKATASGTRANAMLDDIITVPQWYDNTVLPVGNPYSIPGWHARTRSYEYVASCAHANIGGALAAGSLTLYNEGRREGAVWIMVLISDGAAGSSNPVTRNDGELYQAANPYKSVGGFINPLPGSGGSICTDPASPNYPCQHNTTGGYGMFGLCPYGTQAQPSELLKSDAFPNCSDLDPSSRHYCGTTAIRPDTAFDADTNPAGCINYYDVDDYARDWADWIGLSDLPGSASGGTTGRVGDELLPTLFTIGFGINFDTDNAGNPTHCGPPTDPANYDCIRGLAAGTGESQNSQRLRNADYLGEELLRYIADVGDNFQIDSDYWQKLDSISPNSCTGAATDRIGNCINANLSSPDWGPRGSCEMPWTDVANPNNRGNTLLPQAPGQSCGNYYNAPTGQKLQEVFNDIASRMFTRLSQ